MYKISTQLAYLNKHLFLNKKKKPTKYKAGLTRNPDIKNTHFPIKIRT